MPAGVSLFGEGERESRPHIMRVSNAAGVPIFDLVQLIGKKKAESLRVARYSTHKRTQQLARSRGPTISRHVVVNELLTQE